MSNKIYSDNDLERLLAIFPESETNLEEDLMIDQGDGTKGCFNWELRGRGFYLDKQEQYKELSDEELLKSAYTELNSRKNNYNRGLE